VCFVGSYYVGVSECMVQITQNLPKCFAVDSYLLSTVFTRFYCSETELKMQIIRSVTVLVPSLSFVELS
jgi:hypothetical protein